MSVAARLISGSVASWAQIGVTMLSQMALVPIYLSHWNIVTYGIWLAIQSLVGLMATLDIGHQEFLAYEFLRFGPEDRQKLSKYIWSGVCTGMILSFLQILIILLFLTTGALPFLLDKADGAPAGLIRDAGLVVLLQGFTWLLCTSVTGLLTRALAPFGYFPRMAWWGLLSSLVSSVAPVVAVSLGADLLTTGLTAAGVALVFSAGLYADLFRLLRKEAIPFSAPSLRLGYQNFMRSLAISGRVLLESSRQQGARLIIAPLAGAAGLAAFSTMRTGANIALQGLNTVINPLMPELTRFLHQRDQGRSEASFGTIWFVLIAVMAPATVVLQVIVAPLYNIWTRGKVPFDPLLFAILSLGVLVYAVAQPAMAVVRGFNLLRAQLLLSGLTAMVVVLGMWVLVPILGVLGGGLALLLAELAAAIGYRVSAQRWLSTHGLKWPHHHFSIASTSVGLAAVAMGGIIWLPQIQWGILLVALVALYANLWRYWQVLPAVATHRARQIILSLPGLRRLFPA